MFSRWIGVAVASCLVMCSDHAFARRGDRRKWKDKNRKDDDYYIQKQERRRRKKSIGGDSDEGWFDKGHVVHLLTESNFDEFVHLSDKVLIMFYAPWDKRSKKIQPAFMQAAVEANINRNGQDGVLAAFDCHQYPDLCLTLSIEKIPTLYLFENARVDAEFPAKTKHATAENYLSFLTNADNHPHGLKKIRDPDPFTDISHGVVKLGSEEGAEDFDEFIHYHDQVFIQFYAHWCQESHKSFNEVLDLAAGLKMSPEKAVVAAVDCSSNYDLCEYFGISSTPSFKMYRNNAEGTMKEMISFHGHYDKEHFLEFIASPEETRMYGVPDDVMAELPALPDTLGKVHSYNFQDREQWNQEKAASGATRTLPELSYTPEQLELQNKYGYGAYVDENSRDAVRDRWMQRALEKKNRKRAKKRLQKEKAKREEMIKNGQVPPPEPEIPHHKNPNYIFNKKAGVNNVGRDTSGFNKYGIREGGPSFVKPREEGSANVPDIYTSEQQQQQQQYGYERGAQQKQYNSGTQSQQFNRGNQQQQQPQGGQNYNQGNTQQQQQQPDSAEAKRMAYQAYLQRQQRGGGGAAANSPEQTYIPPEGGSAPERVDTVQSAGGMRYNIINN